jgi:hypothetical protein
LHRHRVSFGLRRSFLPIASALSGAKPEVFMKSAFDLLFPEFLLLGVNPGSQFIAG